MTRPARATRRADNGAVDAMTGDLREVIEDHARAPRLRPALPVATPQTGHTAELQRVNPTCGDRVRLRLSVGDGMTPRLRLCGEASGCTLSRASASLLAETIEEITGPPDDVLLTVETFIHRRTHGPWSAPDAGDAALDTIALVPMRVDCVLLSWLCARDLILANADPGA